MQNKKNVLVLILVVVLVALLFVFRKPEVKLDDQNINPNQNIAITGNVDDLVSLSVLPGGEITGEFVLTGAVKNAYFFEANIGVSILDKNKNPLLQTFGTATTDWMTTEPVSFTSNLNVTNLPKGEGYILIENDNPSGEEGYSKKIFIPIVIE